MRTFEFRRHADKDGDEARQMIGPVGFKFACLVGEHDLRGQAFTDFFCSNRFRTPQTLTGFALGAGDFRLKYNPEHAPIYPRVAGAEAMFRACSEAEGRGEPIYRAARLFDESLVREMGRTAAGMFRAWAAELPPDARVLVVGHSPSMEILLFGLCNMVIPSLKECQGFVLKVDGSGEIDADVTSPRLDPARLRAML